MKKGAPINDGIREILQELQEIADSGKTVVAGAWVAEIGFEMLYWIPFLRWALPHFGVDPSRVVAMSRGGVESWYQDVAARYVDVFDCLDSDQFREANERRIAEAGGAKHRQVTSTDRRLLEFACDQIGDSDVAWLHPRLMFDMCSYLWRHQVPMSLIDAYFRFGRLPRLERRPLPLELPERYAAIKFYFSDAFPATESNARFVRDIIQRVSRHLPVVVLHTGLDVDGHRDAGIDRSDRIVVLGHVPLRHNLTIQSRIVCNAEAFFGTYGGFSYVAPSYGVPAISFYSHGDVVTQTHVDVANRAARYLSYGALKKGLVHRTAEQPSSEVDYMVLDVRNLAPLRLLF